MTAVGEAVRADVVVVGGGPAGLTAAASLRRLGVGSVVVLEREATAGGIPRHSDHGGFGLRDLRRALSGAAYARRLADLASDAGADLRTRSMVTGWAGERSLLVTSPGGRYRLDADAVVLATGARERGRPARGIVGDRPAGVLTTGQLQNLVHLRHRPVGSRAVVVGSELVSWSAVLTLRAAGCATALMTTEHDRVEAYGAVAVAGQVGLGVRVARRARVVRIVGRERVEAVKLLHLGSGARRLFACDTVVLTGDWVPDHELARLGGLDVDPGHRGPVVDGALRTSTPGVFAAGNLLHPVDTADVAALDGRHVAESVRRHLAGARAWEAAAPPVRVRAEAPFTWVAPGLLRPGDPAPPRGRLLLWASDYRATPRVTVSQAGTTIAARRLPWPVAPGRVFRVPWSMLAGVRPDAGDVTVGLA